MPPRRILRSNNENRDEKGDSQPPPNQDASARVLAAMAQLLEAAWRCSLWWEGAEQGVNLATLTWEDFKRVLYDKYFTTDVRSRLKREFISLRQHLSVAEFVQKFDRGCHFVPLIALDGLRPTIRHDVMLTGPVDYTTVVAKAFRAEQSLKHIDWEMQRNRNHAQQASQHNKKPYIGPPKRLGQPKLQGQPPKENVSKTTEKPIFKECYRHHYGKCMWGTYKCFKYRAMGHKAGDFQKLKQPMTGRAYVMHAEKAEPDMTLITAGIATYALLDSGATYSFISESFVKKLGILPVDVESEFKVTLPSGEHMVSSNMVKDVELKLQRNIIRADLIVLPMSEFDVILGMDWLTMNGVTIEFW
ncbi:uncharacterized protein LOC142550132 [Primulina tabacum]|uniref:uncharacterized protein LOC142550132 n=1 Tax=Primulina tabacum TaxID=48773 RepID=UPI003F596A37